MVIAPTSMDESLARSQPPPPNRETMYAIAFDLDTAAHHDVRRILEDEGFAWRQGSVYFGDATIDPVRCVLVAQRLTRELPWFAAVARDVRMLRIEENNDLGPAIDATR